MNEWQLTTLGECCEVVSGATPRTSVAEYWDGDICWATPKDISELDGAYISDTPRKLTRAGLDSSGATILPPNSVLFSSRAPIGHVAVNTLPMATNQGFKSFVPKSGKVDAKFLYHWLRFNRTYLESLGNGATFKEVSKAVVARIEIRLPIFSEQRRIAATLDQADAIRAKRRAALERLDSLTNALFLDTFGDPATNPRGFPLRPLGDLSTKFSDGPFGSNLKTSHYSREGVRVVRLQNIGVGEFLDHDAAFVSEEHFAGLKKHECRPGDLLIGTLGDPNLRACIQPDWLPLALNKADCVQLRPDTRVADAQYLCALLNQPSTQKMASGLILGQTRLRISMGRLRGLLVPVPPPDLQAKFAESMVDSSWLREKQQTSLASLDSLFVSLQHGAFHGEL